MVYVTLMWCLFHAKAEKHTSERQTKKKSYGILPRETKTKLVHAIKAWKCGGVTPLTPLQKMKVSGPFLCPL